MTPRNLPRQLLAALLSAAMFAMPVAARADLIGTQQLTGPAGGQAGAHAARDRRMVEQFLARADVQRQLEHLGVSDTLTSQRVAALSDAEVASLASRIQSLPAAGTLGFQETVIILLVAILVVLAV